MYKLKNDKFRRKRGGHSRLLDVCCEKCGAHICYYQKDGSGILKRMYLDRIFDLNKHGKFLKCEKCQQVLGVSIIYEKEKRPAFRLFVGAVTKKLVSSSKI